MTSNYSLSPLAIVRLFLTSMTLVIFCLLFSSIAYVPVKGEIISNRSFHLSSTKLAHYLCPRRSVIIRRNQASLLQSRLELTQEGSNSSAVTYCYFGHMFNIPCLHFLTFKSDVVREKVLVL